MTTAEFESAQGDNALLQELSLGLGWRDVSDAWLAYLESEKKALAHVRSSEVRPDVVAPLNEAVRSVFLAVSRLHEKLAASAERIADEETRRTWDQASNRVRWEATAGVVAMAGWSAVATPLVDVVVAEVQPGISRPVVCLSAASAKNLGVVVPDHSFVAQDVLSRLAGAGEFMVAALIASLKEQHQAASRRLRELALEITLGPPALIRMTDGISIGQHQLDIQVLRIDLGQVLAGVAIHGERRIKELLAENDGPIENASASPGPAEPAAADAETSESNVDAAPDPQAPEEPESEEPSLNIRFTPSSVLGMLSEMRGLSSSLEYKWSRALELLLDEEDLEDEMVRWSALVQAVQAAAEERSERDRAAGLDTAVAAFPVPIEQVASVFGTAGSRYMQETIGHLYAFAHLASSLHILQMPTTEVLSSADGYSKFWSSGGFSVARAAATVAEESLRSLEAVDATTSQPSGSDGDASTAPMHRYLDSVSAAQRAKLAGLPDAVLVYLARASSAYEEMRAGPLFAQDYADLLQQHLGHLSRGGSIATGVAISLSEIGLAAIETKSRELFGGPR